MSNLFIFIIFLIGVTVGLIIGLILARLYGRPPESVPADDEAMLQARQAVAKRTRKRLDRIMSVALEEGSITNNGVEELFCISDRTASTYLNTLTKEGKLQRQGGGRSTFYTPSK